MSFPRNSKFERLQDSVKSARCKTRFMLQHEYEVERIRTIRSVSFERYIYNSLKKMEAHRRDMEYNLLRMRLAGAVFTSTESTQSSNLWKTSLFTIIAFEKKWFSFVTLLFEWAHCLRSIRFSIKQSRNYRSI